MTIYPHLTPWEQAQNDMLRFIESMGPRHLGFLAITAIVYIIAKHMWRDVHEH
jgi:hypothetical protein